MKKNANAWLFSVIGKKNIYVLLLLILKAMNGASGVFYALFLRTTVDGASTGNRDQFWKGVTQIVLLVLLQITLRAMIRWLSEYSASTFENLLKARLFHLLTEKDYLSVSAVHSGEWMTRLTNDCSMVADSYADILPGLAEMAVKLISAVIMLLFLEYRFALILIPAGLLLFVFTTLFRAKMKTLYKEIQAANGRLRIFLQERLGSLLMIHSFATERATQAQAKEKMEEHLAARMRKTRFSLVCNLGFNLSMEGIYVLGIAWCAYGILTETITFGTMTAITQLISQIESPIANVTAYLPRYYAMLASTERIMEAQDLADAFETEPESISSVRELYGSHFRSFGLKNADFAYYAPTQKVGELSKSGESPAIHDLSLEIHKGEYVAFVGSSGCGKSTALKLLTCTYAPDAGTRYYVLEDGTTQELTFQMRRLFAYVPQGNHLMSGTIRDVVCFSDNGDDAASNDRLHEALKIACAEEFVSQLSDGMDTMLGERGTGLSEGQMQRLAIARAIYSDAPILLLDESTSALDAETERSVLQNLKSLTDRTVVIVTHRPAALEICDRVITFAESTAEA